MSKPSPALVVATIALVLAAGGVTLAAIPDNGVVHGCYQTSPGTGALRQLGVRDTTESCPSGFAPIDWNVAGQAGQAGPPGPAGPAGPASLPSVLETYAGKAVQVFTTPVPTLAALHLTPGRWLLLAKLNLADGTDPGVLDECALEDGNPTPLDRVITIVPRLDQHLVTGQGGIGFAEPTGLSVSLMATHEFAAATTVKVVCQATDDVLNGQTASNISFVAIPLAAINPNVISTNTPLAPLPAKKKHGRHRRHRSH